MVVPINIAKGSIKNIESVLKGIAGYVHDGVYLLRLNYAGQPKNVTEARKYYFALLDIQSTEGNSGYTTKELHEVMKKGALPQVDEHYTSTKELTLDEWYQYIQEVKKYMKENFEFYI